MDNPLEYLVVFHEEDSPDSWVAIDWLTDESHSLEK